MKRTTLLLLTFVSIFFSALTAAPIERATALQYAKQFISQTSVPQYAPGKVSASFVEPEPIYVSDDVTTGTPLYYIYNLSNDGGFIIVAADTRVRTILGYSFNGSFDEKNIPINMRGWLDEYSSQIAYAIKQNPVSDTKPVVARSKSVSNAVAPLLGDIQYNQGAPYNNLCPLDGDKRSVTGCVATAMVQVMRYYKHPQVGRGTKTYTTQTLNQELTVDFSTAYYDWENMLPSYDGTATETQKTAIATVMYHAGVAAEMDYSASGSAASTALAARSMYEFFDYDIAIDEAQRKYYTAGEWLQLIKNEIDATRPIIYSGRSKTGGHAFICDGYDADDFVHINWGWGGYQDGYFHLSAFNPKGGGIGAGDTGYNLKQSIFYKIQKPIEGSVLSAVMGMEEITVDKDSISEQDTVKFVIPELRARSLFGFKGQIALALYDEDRNFVQTIKLYNVSGTTLPSAGWGWKTFTIDNITMSHIRPNDSIVGKFYIKPVYRSQGTDGWQAVLVENGKVGEIYTEIGDSVIRFIKPEMKFTLTEAASAVVKNTPYTIFDGKKLNVELQIANSGNVEYRAQVGIKAISLADESNMFEIANVKTILPVGETTTVNLGGVIDFPEGEYKLEAYYNPVNQEDDFTFPTEKIQSDIEATIFTVIEKPEPYSLSLAKTTQMPSVVERGKAFQFKATINNSGGLFAGNLVLRFLKKLNDGTTGYRYIYNAKPYYVEIFTETKEIVMECVLDLPPATDYAALLHYESDEVAGQTTSFGNDSKNWRYLTIKEKDYTDVVNITASSSSISIFPNPGTTFVTVKTNEPADRIQIIDLTGKIVLEEKGQGDETTINVQALLAGIYIVNAGGNTAKLVVKK
ncbi:MAG TPA: T9SS type A sorting domain-containing protein [Bacteroidales bacterium]|nr:T9SS type A sorting domain-containing protein [Bacteroidales bacterium]